MPARPRIALIHATPIAVEPIRQAFATGWADAETVNIMDDSLSPDRAAAPGITDELTERMVTLARYAVGIGADGILFTCSSFGSAIEEAARQLPVPVLKPNEAMFEAAMARGRRLAMIATFPPSRASMEEEFRADAIRVKPEAELTTFVVEPAIRALNGGDAETHNRLVAEQAAGLDGFDAIMLAHFSTSRARAAVNAVTATPVLTSPDAAVEKIRRLVAPSA